MVDDRLALQVTHVNDTVTRWGAWERDSEDVPHDLSFGTSIPGGFKDLRCSLLRGLFADISDQALLDLVKVVGPGGAQTAWEGRMTQFPRDDGSVTPGAVGLSAHMLDFPGFTEIYVDRDISHWGDPTLNEKVRLATGGTSFGDFSWTSGFGGLICALPNQALGASTIAEAYYAAPAGVKISQLQWVGATTSQPAGWINRWAAQDADSFTSPETYTPTLNGTLQSQALSPARRYVAQWLYSNSTAATPAAGANVRFTKLAAYGTHGLTGHSPGSGEPDGFYGHDMIADIVSRCCPLLTATQGTGGIESNTSFVVPQAAFLDPVNASDGVLEINKYFLWEWGIYDDRKFFWRAPDPNRLTWSARTDRGAHISEEGETAEQQFNGVLVFYTDAEGKRRVAGPPAANWPNSVALADTTNSALVDTSATNPVNAHGIPQRWGKLELSFPTTDAGATQIGTVWLAEHSLPQRRGTITLTGTVEHPSEGNVPVWRVRAGDWIKVGDIPGDEPRRIIETSYSHGPRQLTATVGNTDFKLDALLERVGVSLVGVAGI